MHQVNPHYPPIKGTRYDSVRDYRYRVWTVADTPFGRFPTYGSGGPSVVAHTEWNVSYPRLSKALSSPSVVARDDGKIELSIHRVTSSSGEPYASERHPLDGTRYDTDEDAARAAYEAGVTAFMVYLKEEPKHGINIPE